jgi:hypothetical protein
MHRNRFIAAIATSFLLNLTQPMPTTAQNAPATAALPLPAKTDIPADLGGVVICPNEATAMQFYRDYFKNGSGTMIDIDLFFTGIKATGCIQGGGPMTIISVQERKKLVDGSYIRFVGTLPGGKSAFAIVNENSVISMPRTDLERWQRTYYTGDKLTVDATPKNAHAYLCATPDIARKFVKSIPDYIQKGITKSMQLRAKNRAIKTYKCSLAKGDFSVTAVHEIRTIDIAFEVAEDWTALTAIDAQGRTIGIVFDASLI